MDFKHVSRMWVTPQDSEHEFPEKKLDLYKLESKPIVLFQAANMCHSAETEKTETGSSATREVFQIYDVGVSMFSGELEATSVLLSSDFLLPSATVRFTEELCFGFTNHPT